MERTLGECTEVVSYSPPANQQGAQRSRFFARGRWVTILRYKLTLF
ncbi:hypothetical protein FHS09_001882 [Microbulbifer rhizosphaerae]|uniref:Uncharacterized protein n=1 Tax=Microbulbifer rhizosphaerae TaxID=1562603 RepID=A0A7W4WB62_9GAMM|nr:hypothetical protein [Microbulbifer rhizosphaerae]